MVHINIIFLLQAAVYYIFSDLTALFCLVICWNICNISKEVQGLYCTSKYDSYSLPQSDNIDKYVSCSLYVNNYSVRTITVAE